MKKIKVKGWAVVESDGQFRKAYWERSVAELNCSSYAGERLVPCTLSYELEPSGAKRPKQHLA